MEHREAEFKVKSACWRGCHLWGNSEVEFFDLTRRSLGLLLCPVLTGGAGRLMDGDLETVCGQVNAAWRWRQTQIRLAESPKMPSRQSVWNSRSCTISRSPSTIGETERCYRVFRRLNDPQAGETRPGKQILLVCDGAGWPVSPQVQVPSGIHLHGLPPDTPEL
jgi:hypothetical protein